MKKILTLAGLLLFAGMCTINAQRGMRMDSVMMNRMRRNRMDLRSDSLWMRRNRMNLSEDSIRMRFYHRGNDNIFMMPRAGARWQIPRYGLRRDIRTVPLYGMRWDRRFMRVNPRGMNRNRMDRPFPGRIPSLTEEQRNDISELRQKQQSEINKIREDNFAEMEKMRESHREELLKILTEEQKEWIENNRPVN
jgi:hypothetical protein